ncbi:hypothetical protein [Phenylobacterium sp.]|uniref:hypothetical protein n=1 Tax=Phenylobacterium sp. TaxID=1871053 RepID=UPI002FC9C7E1
MALATEMGWDEARLERRVGFLRDRAQAHLAQDDPGKLTMAIACAGNLLREAAATAIMLQQFDAARDLLVEAGELWAKVGLFSGYAMIALGRPEAWWEDRRSDLEDVMSVMVEAESSETAIQPRERHERAPMMVGSAGATRQLLHLYQSLRPHIDQGGEDISGFVSNTARNRLMRAPTAQVGATEAPVQAYVHLFESSVRGELDRAARDTLTGIVLRRVEQLEAARADEFHWRMGLSAAALVDFDLLALLIASVDAQGTVDVLAEHFGDRGDDVRLPLIAARGIRRGLSDKPEPPLFG